MRFELAEVIAELGEGVVVGRELEGGEDGLVDLPRAPSSKVGTAVEKNFHQAEHAGPRLHDSLSLKILTHNLRGIFSWSNQVISFVQNYSFTQRLSCRQHSPYNTSRFRRDCGLSDETVILTRDEKVQICY